MLRVMTDVRCRKCASCRRARAREWRARAQIECARADRTWFGTLTLRPEEAYRLECAARRRAQGGEVTPSLFAAESAEWLTRYLKRVRKSAHGKLRYLCVMELHQSGLPHWHLLVHERGGRTSERTLRGQWYHGFTKWKLTEGTREAGYVTKYLTKSAEARVRASQKYGETILIEPVGLSVERPERNDHPPQERSGHGLPTGSDEVGAPTPSRAVQSEVIER